MIISGVHSLPLTCISAYFLAPGPPQPPPPPSNPPALLPLRALLPLLFLLLFLLSEPSASNTKRHNENKPFILHCASTSARAAGPLQLQKHTRGCLYIIMSQCRHAIKTYLPNNQFQLGTFPFNGSSNQNVCGFVSACVYIFAVGWGGA